MRNLSGSSPRMGRTFCKTGLYFFFIERNTSEKWERSESLFGEEDEWEEENLEEEGKEELEETKSRCSSKHCKWDQRVNQGGYKQKDKRELEKCWMVVQ